MEVGKNLNFDGTDEPKQCITVLVRPYHQILYHQLLTDYYNSIESEHFGMQDNISLIRI